MFAKAKDIFAIPFINNAVPERIATTQKDIIGKPNMIIKPTKNNTTAATPLQIRELNILRIFEINDTDEILSNKKKTPIKATNQRILTLGTNNNKIPIVRINSPKKIE